MDKILTGDCFTLLPTLPPNSVDLILTSPPYAEQRKNQYFSIPEYAYPEWTTRWMNCCIPLLKPLGSVAIIIRTNLRDGHISDYVLRTRIALHDSGWMEPEELIWVKPDSPPLGSIKRPRRSWENIIWLSRGTAFCDPKANGVPSKRIGLESKKGLGSYKSGASKATEGIARCRDYFTAGTSTADKNKENTHPAIFPVCLATQLINLLCPPGGVVLDPFVGSGTTAIACIETKRHFIGIDISDEYCLIARKRISELSKL